MDRTNCINTWQQGKFIDGSQFKYMPDDWKARRAAEELHLVRPSSKGHAICWCANPDDAKWIAERLNFAANLEQRLENEIKMRGG